MPRCTRRCSAWPSCCWERRSSRCSPEFSWPGAWSARSRRCGRALSVSAAAISPSASSIKTGDELEGLANQFNDMGARLQESYADLENKVEVRTAELSEVARAADSDLGSACRSSAHRPANCNRCSRRCWRTRRASAGRISAPMNLYEGDIVRARRDPQPSARVHRLCSSGRYDGGLIPKAASASLSRPIRWFTSRISGQHGHTCAGDPAHSWHCPTSAGPGHLSSCRC